MILSFPPVTATVFDLELLSCRGCMLQNVNCILQKVNLLPL